MESGGCNLIPEEEFTPWKDLRGRAGVAYSKLATPKRLLHTGNTPN
jgi:hypothetical protein